MATWLLWNFERAARMDERARIQLAGPSQPAAPTRLPLTLERRHERRSLRWRLHRAAQNLASRDRLPVQLRIVVFIDLEDAAGYVDAGEQPVGSRIRQDFRRQLDVRRGTGISADGARRRRCLGAESDLVVQQFLHALLVHHEQHEIDCLRACLKAPASFVQPQERRRRPRTVMLAAHHPSTILAAEYEGGLLQVRDDDHASGLVPQLAGYVLVWRRVNLSKYLSRLRNTLDVVGVGSAKGRRQYERQRCRDNLSLHVSMSS